MNPLEIMKKLAADRIGCQLTYDYDYGIDHRGGWSFTVDGSVLSQFKASPEEAVVCGIVGQYACYHQDFKNGD